MSKIASFKRVARVSGGDLAGPLQRLLDPLPLVRSQTGAELRQHLLVGGDHRFEAALRVGHLTALMIRFGERRRLLDDSVDLVLREAAGRIDLDSLRLARGQVARGDVDDAVGVDGEGDLDLRNAARGAAGMPTSSNRPSDLFSRATSRSPCRTWISTTDWLSATVVNTLVFLVGIVELRSINFSNTPPCISMPSDSGVTSRRTTSLISPFRTPP